MRIHDWYGLMQSQLVQHFREVRKDRFVIGRHFVQPADPVQRSCHISVGQAFEQSINVIFVDGAQHAAHIGLIYAPATKCNGLVQQAQRVTHAAVGRTRQQLQGHLLEFDLVGAENLLELSLNESNWQALEVELQAA